MTTKLEQQLAAELALLREALEPFADIRYPDAVPDGAGFASRRNGRHVSYGDIRRARELLRSNDLGNRLPATGAAKQGEEG